MTIEERAEKIVRQILRSSAAPFHVAGTETQQNAVIADATAQVLAELKDFAATLCIKFE